MALLALVAASIVGVSLNSLIKEGVETLGPEATGAPVTVDAVSISLLGGGAKLTGLKVGNPRGYKTPSAMKVGRASVVIRAASLLADKLHIRSFELDSPEVTLEASLAGSNLSAIMANIEAYVQKTRDRTKPSRKLQVDRLAVTGAKLNMGVPLSGGKTIAVTLPDIQLADLGAGPEGITGAELAQRVFREILNAATRAASGTVGRGAEALGSVVQGAGKKAGDALDQAAQGLGSLLKK